MGFNGTFSTIRLYSSLRAFTSSSLVNRLISVIQCIKSYVLGNGNTLGVLYIYSVVIDQRHWLVARLSG